VSSAAAARLTIGLYHGPWSVQSGTKKIGAENQHGRLVVLKSAISAYSAIGLYHALQGAQYGQYGRAV